MSTKQGYSKIYALLVSKRETNSVICVDDLASAVGLKQSTIRVYIRNRLKKRYLRKRNDGKFDVLDKIESVTSEEFVDWMCQNTVADEADEPQWVSLVANANSSILAAVELHNKPRFEYRYQVVTILVINAWELALKAYIAKYDHTIKLENKDGTTKPFDECLGYVAGQLRKQMPELKDNLEVLYQYRCKFIHYYAETLDVILFSIIYKSVHLYHRFVLDYIDERYAINDDFVILPIGFKKPVSPCDFLTNESVLSSASSAVKSMVGDIIDRTKKLADAGIEETFFVPYKIACINEERSGGKNADIIAAITKSKNASITVTQQYEIGNTATKKIQVEENTLYTELYPYSHNDVCEQCKTRIVGWKKNRQFYNIMRELKQDSKYHKERLLDPKIPNGLKKDFYSSAIIDAIKSKYDVEPLKQEQVVDQI